LQYDPSTMGLIGGGGFYGYREFDTFSATSLYTVMANSVESMMMQIVGASEPAVVVTDPNQSKSNDQSGPCIAKQ
jgi:hypothetical protein